MNAKEFLKWELKSRDTIEVKRIYVDIAGDLAGGILLSQLIYWFLPNKSGKSKLTIERDGKMWLAKAREDWWDECRISIKQFDRCSEKLESLGIIKTSVFKFGGNPVKHITLDFERISVIVSSILNDETCGCHQELDMENIGYCRNGNNDITHCSVPTEREESSLPKGKNPSNSTETTAEITLPGFQKAEEVKEPKPLKDSSESDHTTFVKLYTEAYQKQFGKKYLFDGKKDGPAVKRLIAVGKPDEIVGMIVQLWNFTGFVDRFVMGSSMSIHKIQGVYNQIQASLSNSKAVNGGYRRNNPRDGIEQVSASKVVGDSFGFTGSGKVYKGRAGVQ